MGLNKQIILNLQKLILPRKPTSIANQVAITPLTNDQATH